MTDNLLPPFDFDKNPETSTFAAVDNIENTIREWESRLHDTNRGASRWMNQSTVNSLLNAIRNDESFMTVAFLSIANPKLTHTQLMSAYHDPAQGVRLFKQIFGGGNQTDPQVMLNIDSDLAALSMQDDRTKNGRVFALRAAVAWLSNNDDALREYANMAAYLDSAAASLPQTDPRVPASTDTLTVVMGTLVAMRAQSKLDDEYARQFKKHLDELKVPDLPEPSQTLGGIVNRMPQMPSVPTYRTPQMDAPLMGVRI
ncbi:hypothetical protein [Bifidobacterium callitrichidarum]|uniref:Uncharacterized protein n=1 Tax=Bifidobacterium callitrichidarum TaxID=2052941 RepID=A0A2U2NCA2_9BIFI|nr:hypothetical protein [Bifidobacterium callitrichidarum]PWG66733.1 hypothetical protein DF196_02185 [Bifidobacterium callitrichidarum]